MELISIITMLQMKYKYVQWITVIALSYMVGNYAALKINLFPTSHIK